MAVYNCYYHWVNNHYLPPFIAMALLTTIKMGNGNGYTLPSDAGFNSLPGLDAGRNLAQMAGSAIESHRPAWQARGPWPMAVWEANR